MKKRKGSLLQRTLAVLLSTVLITGMVSNVVSASVLAQEQEETQEGVSGNAVETGEGDTTPEEGTESAEETEQETLPPAEEIGEKTPGTGTEEETEPETDSEDTVAGEENEILQALLARIDALPDAEEYLATEPDMDSGEAEEDAYEKWMAELYAHAEEALAIREAVEELSEEEYGQISEEALAKLAAWTAVAEQAEESSMVMLAEAAPQADNIASGTGWVLDADGKLTITSNDGTRAWRSSVSDKTQVKSVEIQDGVTSIGESAFNRCSSLTSITIPAGVTSIESGAFQKCSSLTNITIPEKVASIGNYAFNGCSGLTNITIPAGVTSIGNYAFNGCSSLTNVIMERGEPPKLGAYVFSDCKFVADKTQGIHVPEGKAGGYKTAWKDWEPYITDGTHTHNYGDWQHDSAQHWKVCSCGNEIDRGNHDFGNWITDRAATATEAGTKHRDCQTCGYTETGIIPATGESHTHHYGDWQHDSTQHWKVCSCGDEIDRGNHDFGNWITDRAATATETGAKHRDCQTCSYTETGIIPATGSSGGGNQGGGNTGDNQGGGNAGDNQGGGNTGGNQGGGNTGGNQDDNGGNDGSGGSDGGNNGGAGDNPDSGGSGSSGTGTTAPAPGASGTGQPRVKQEKEGNIRKEVSVTGESTLDAAIETPLSKLADIVLTETEKQQAAAGTDIKIVLAVKDASAAVSAADKKSVEAALGGSLAKGYALGQYLDISLYKVVGNNRNIIKETNGRITVTLNVPDKLKNTDSAKLRTFAVIRVHDGKAALLTDLDNDEDTITIETDRFSTYAIVWQDTAGKNGGVLRVSVKNDGGRESGGKKDDEPDTGDASPFELCVTLPMIAGFTYLLLYFTDRRHGMTEETKKELVSRLIGWAKQGGRIRRCLALSAIFVLLVYYHSVGRKTCMEWEEIYGE